MRLVSYLTADGTPAVGRLKDGVVHRLEDVPVLDTSISPERLRDAKAVGDGHPLDGMRLLPVSPRPKKILCVGLNYMTHIEETGRDLPTYPVWFAKFASSLVAHEQPVVAPSESHQVDFEAELAVVIGRPGRRIAAADAWSHILGFTIANDVTMRDYQYKTHQWLQGKAWDSSTPLGPVLVTPDEVDATDLDLRLCLNGTEMQSSNTSRMIFDIPRLIHLASEFTQLEPGDVILTGTPSGVGFRRDPQVFLTEGDVVEVEIEGLGTLRNTVRAETREGYEDGRVERPE